MSASALRDAEPKAGSEAGACGDAFEARLAAAALRGDRKSCDADKRGCGAAVALNTRLVRAPSCFTVVVNWESSFTNQSAVAATLHALATRLQPENVFRGRRTKRKPDADVFELRAGAIH